MWKNRLLALVAFHLSLLAVVAQTTWGDIDYKGKPWVKCASRAFDVDHGLDGRHITVWASHGRYYDNSEDRWRWQRPALFGTTEDLFTQTIVVPYLIPMLENAGAVVFTPRERDWQRNEVIVDNDDRGSLLYYQEQAVRHTWTNAPQPGFAQHDGNYKDGENPFVAGTARMIETARSKSKASSVSYQPLLPQTGRYAVYVSYQTVEGSVDDAHYTVWHQGQPTEFRVNQQMGGSTWVYLGTFEFDEGCTADNRVVLTNQSDDKGFVTTDAVRFGGGMGNIERGGQTSRMPRCLEGARYWAQWAGMPYEVYSSKGGVNDYADDINARSLMSNLLCGGSVFAPDSAGRRVPIELSLAVHSDAGHTPTGEGVYGTLTICTTSFGDSTLAAGTSREMSRELATALFDNTKADLSARFGQWENRKIYDRNYSETRVPIVPSAILETMSHQNFGDMRYGQDPTFRFFLARSVYKTLLRYITSRHGEQSVIQPLPPDNFHVEFTHKAGEVCLSWQGVIESATNEGDNSAPTGYVLYMAMDGGGYDNGTPLRGTSCNIRLKPNVLYRFRVTATNDGGQSFPTEELVALYNPKARHKALVVNGFHRLSSPSLATSGQGFDLSDDIGVSYGRTPGWLGLQRVFDQQRIGVEDSTGLGFTTNELEGTFIAGNDFCYPRTHAEAIAASGRFSIVSASVQAVEQGQLNLADYLVVDLLLGLERNDGHSLMDCKTFRPVLQKRLRVYTTGGGRLLVSGAYVGTDMMLPAEQNFLADVLKVRFDSQNRQPDGNVSGLGLKFDFYRQLNESHYAATSTDILMPAATASANSFPAMVYANGTSAAVAYQGSDYRAFTMGFPFECITDGKQRQQIMKGILNFLIQN